MPPPIVCRLLLAGTFLALVSAEALPQSPGNAYADPSPRPRTAIGEVLDKGATVSLARQSEAMPAPLEGGSTAILKSGLDALAGGDVAGTRTIRDQFPATSLDRRILTWAIAMRGGSAVASGEIATAARALPGWPGMEALRENSERAMLRENPPPAVVVQAFGSTAPQTAEGAIILARSLVAMGERDRARGVLQPLWRTTTLDAKNETAILTEFGTLIPKADHRERMERMLYAERVSSARRVAALAGAPALADAWSAVIKGDPAAMKLLGKVPTAQRSAGYVFAEARALRRKKEFTQAAALILGAPRDRASLVDPDAWWVERRALSRELVDQGDIKSAYRLAAAHSAESPADAADAEFHAGWYALRGLGDAKTGARHFARIAEIADGPISLARAYYWLGRAAEAGGPGNAQAYYLKAAGYGTAFYGQLAAAKLGRGGIAIPYPSPSAVDRQAFAQREAVQAIRRLEDAGYEQRAEVLYRDLAGTLDSPGELALLAAMAERHGNHFLALKVGKIAAYRGVEIGALAHPLGAIPADAHMSGAGMALAYAIARQESEFNVGAVSGAGARGLLQLLPGTAKDVAKRAGMPYSMARLTTDAGYNATLGAAFLGEQLGRFDGSYVLTFAGYNAGPRRAQEWVARYGDPRGKDIDTVVDWIERIPFSETRSYVQRVMENYQVYKMRLAGRFDIASDLMTGR